MFLLGSIYLVLVSELEELLLVLILAMPFAVQRHVGNNDRSDDRDKQCKLERKKESRLKQGCAERFI